MIDDSANAQQATYWTDVGGPQWVKQQRQFDYMLARIGQEAERVLAPQPGEAILDVGCGTATTTLSLAESVTESGRVVGCDISPVMIDAARARSRKMPNVSFRVADAQTAQLVEAGHSFDGVYSRFGVMFFADPTVAFANLRRTVRRGGRLTFSCWRDEELNPWIHGPATIMRGFTPEPVYPLPDAPGPFAFGDEQRVRRMLDAAGWSDVAIKPYTTPVALGEGQGVDAAVTHVAATTVAQTLRAQVDAATFLEATAAVRAMFADNVVDGAVTFSASAWIVAAVSP